MYGMVNRAIEDMVVSTQGTAAWEKVKSHAGIDVDVFISHDPYPDEVTYRLVASASEVLSVPAEDLLEQFGRFWVLNTAERGYGEMMRAGGRSLPEFFENLPGFHTRVAMIFPELIPPRFECTDRTPFSLRLHYHTKRPGLSRFTRGLILGLGERFGTQITVTQTDFKVGGDDHDIFLIEWPEGAVQ